MAIAGTPLPPPRTHRGLAPVRHLLCRLPRVRTPWCLRNYGDWRAGLEPHRRTSGIRIRLARGLARRRRPAGRRTHRSDARYVRPRRHAAGTAPCGHRPRTWLFRSARPGQAGLGYDVARTLAGRDAYRSGPDPLLWWSPWALSALAVLLVLGAATWARLTRLGGRERRHNRAWAWGLSLASVLLASAAWYAPRALGHDRRQRMIWLPDLWWATTALCCAGVLAALVVTVSGIRRRGAGTPSPGGRSPAPR